MSLDPKLLAAQDRISGLRRVANVLAQGKSIRRTTLVANIPAGFLETAEQLRQASMDLLIAQPGADVSACAEAASGVECPWGVELDLHRPADVARQALACGATSLRLPAARLLQNADEIDAVDTLLGEAHASGCEIVREIAPLSPPYSVAANVAAALLETQLATDSGARNVLATIGLSGALLNDVAAIGILRELAASWLAPRAGAMTLSFGAAWSAPPPSEFDQGYALTLNNALAAALAKVDVYTQGPIHANASAGVESAAEALRCVRQMFVLLAGQSLEDSAELSDARQRLRTDVLHILGIARGDGARDAMKAIAGRLDAHRRTSDASDLFAPLPRIDVSGLTSYPLPPWSDDPLSRAAR